MKSLNFIKMHGLGNDFVIFNSTEKKLHDPKFIKKISDRKTGIGCDLVVITKNSDIIYIGGGNTKSMLAVFKEWNLDSLILNAYKNGTILAGVSAGAICWFNKGITDSWAHGLKVLNCMNVLNGVCCPHYDGEANRRPSVEKFLKNNVIDECLCIEDGAAVHFENENIKHAISFYKNKNAYEVSYKNKQLFENPLSKIDI